MNTFAKRGAILFACGVLLACGACRSTSNEVHHRDPAFDPSGELPLRLAVLPFEDRTGGRSWWVYPLYPFIWLGNILSFQLPETPPDPEDGKRTLRNLTIAWMNASNKVDVLSPFAVDTTLRHRGLLDRASELSSRELGEILDVDAVVYCTLDAWGSDYYILDTRQLIQGTMRVYSAYDGMELYHATTTTTDRAGASQVPGVTSASPVAIAGLLGTPLDALGDGDYDELAVQWVSMASWGFLGLDLDPEALEDGGLDLGSPPVLSMVAVNAKPSGSFHEGDLIQVVTAGTPGGQATFDLGPLRRGIPMSEVVRGSLDPIHGDKSAGRYVGSYFVMAGDRLENAPITVRLRSGQGRVARRDSLSTVRIDTTK